MPKTIIAFLIATSFLAQAGGAFAGVKGSISFGSVQQGQGEGSGGQQELSPESQKGMGLLKKKHSPVQIPGMGKMGQGRPSQDRKTPPPEDDGRIE